MPNMDPPPSDSVDEVIGFAPKIAEDNQDENGETTKFTNATNRVRTEMDEMRNLVRQASASAGRAELAALQVTSLQNRVTKLERENRRLIQRDFVVQLRELCMIYEAHIRDNAGLGERFKKTMSVLWREWSRNPPRPKYVTALQFFKEEAASLAQDAQEEGCVFPEAVNPQSQAGSFSTTIVANACEWVSENYVHCKDLVDEDFLLECMREFYPTVRVGGNEFDLSIIEKSFWIAFIKHVFRVVPALKPQTLRVEVVDGDVDVEVDDE